MRSRFERRKWKQYDRLEYELSAVQIVKWKKNKKVKTLLDPCAAIAVMFRFRSNLISYTYIQSQPLELKENVKYIREIHHDFKIVL